MLYCFEMASRWEYVIMKTLVGAAAAFLGGMVVMGAEVFVCWKWRG